MKNPKVLLGIIGGVCALLVLVAAVFAYGAYSAKVTAMEGGDDSEGLEAVLGQAKRLLHKKPFPGAPSLREITSNRTQLVTWQDDAKRLVSAGDRVYAKTTSAAFKTFIVSDAKRLATLPGDVHGALAKKDFTFGPFKEYIAEGKMPAEDKLPELQRRWDDVATVAEALSESGVSELVDIAFKDVQASEQAAAAPTPTKSNKRRKPASRAAKKEAADSSGPSAYSYVITFTTRPLGFVKTVNALAKAQRFIVVDDYSFARDRDVLGESLGGTQKAEATQTRSSRRGRRGSAQPREAKETESSQAKSSVVTDPVMDPPFKVTMSVTIYDFRSLEEEKK